jgi:hypothetical protein
MKAIITTSLLILLGVSLGLFLSVLLPFVFVAWLSDWWQTMTRRPVRCDAGNPSPTNERTTRRPDPEKEPGLYALWEADQKEQRRIEQRFNELFADAGECPHGITPVDNCLMCAIEPDDEPDTDGGTRLLDWLLEAKRQSWVNSVEQALEKKVGRTKE